MKKFALILAAALLLCIISAPASVLAADETEYILPVFETADLHGYLVDTGFEESADYQYRFARIADIVEDRRGGSTEKTLLLDGGDVYSGNAIQSQQAGNPVSAAYAAVRYDAVALGGHEFDIGLENAVDADGTMPDYALNGLSGANTVPVLCSNLFNAKDGSRVTRTKDYVILEKTAVATSGATRTVRIAVIGYLHNMSGSILPDKIADYTVNDSLAPVDALAKKLKEEQNVDAVVLLAHRDAKKTAAALPNGTAVDLVCGADSHYAQYGTEKTAYIQPSAKARGYASAELRFTGSTVSVASQRTVSVTLYPSMLHDTPGNSYNLNASVMTVSRLAVEGIRPLLEATLGTITTAITSDSVTGSSMASTGGNWMTDMANRACGTQVSFTNSGGIATSLLLTNGVHTVTKADIYNLAPYSNRLYVYSLRYSELLGILNWAVSHTNMNLRMSGIDCYYSDSGVSALVQDGLCIFKDGAWANGYQERYVRVSANEYVATYAYGPFAGYAATDRSKIDNESFIAVLEAEGKANGGQLTVDKTPHFLKLTYTGGLAEVVCEHEHAYPEHKDATCTEAGYDKMICDDCGAVISETVLPALGHDLIIDAEIPATCTEEGLSEGQHCSRCTYQTARFYLPALGHDWDEGKITAEPTATKGGEKTYTCARCGATKTEPIPATGECDGGKACPSYKFTDVKTGDWYHEPVDFAVRHALFNGMTETTFEPDTPMTRAMLVTVLWRYAGQPEGGANNFADVKDGEWYAKAVAWAAENGVVNGIGSGKFDPNGSITREQMAAILYRYVQKKGLGTSVHGDLSGFPDRTSVSAWATDAIAWAVAEKLITGSDGRLDPQGSATRAQVATILMRFIETVAMIEITIVSN